MHPNQTLRYLGHTESALNKTMFRAFSSQQLSSPFLVPFGDNPLVGLKSIQSNKTSRARLLATLNRAMREG